MSYSFNFVQSNFAAEEVVGNVMLILWEDRVKFESITDIKSYLYAMVKNSSLTYLKKEMKVFELDPLLSEEPEHFDFDILEEEVHAILIEALHALPDGCREIFELSCLEGMKYKDIASQLDVSVNTVKSQRARAIELLKKKLKDHPSLLFILLFL